MARTTRKLYEILVLGADAAADSASVVEEFAKYRDAPGPFFREVLGLELVPKQEQALSLLLVPPYRVLCPSGNTLGKCVEENELITLADGSRVPAGELVGKQFVIPTLHRGKVVECLGLADWNATESVYELTTECGHKIIRNAEHPIWAGRARFKVGMTPRIDECGWRSLGSLVPGLVVAIAQEMPVGGAQTLTDDELKIMAYLIGDGSLTKSGVSSQLGFTQAENEQLDEMKSCVSAMGAKLTAIKSSPYNYGISGADAAIRTRTITRGGRGAVTHTKNPVRDLIKRLGLAGKHSREKFIPPEVFRQPMDKQALFLNRLFATDGWACVTSKNGADGQEIGFCSISERLCRDIQAMLVRFGLHFKLYRRSTVNAWTLTLHAGGQVMDFADKIGIYGKDDAVWAAATRAASQQREHKWRTVDVPRGARWEKVVSVRYVGESRTVAIEVPRHHTFITPVYEHNSLMGAGAVIWWHCTRSPGKVITTAPTAKSLETGIWSELRELASRAKDKIKLNLMPRACEIRRSHNDFVLGLTANSEDAFKGKHGPNQFFLFDEAPGIKPEFWRATETMFQPPGHAWLVLYNPTDSSSQVWAEQNGVRRGTKSWHIVTMSAAEHPNIQLELDGKPPLIEHAVRLSWFEQTLFKYSQCVGNSAADEKGLCQPGDILWPPPDKADYCKRRGLKPRWYRPGPHADYMLFGRFPRQGSSAVWGEGDWMLATREGMAPLPLKLEIPEIGVDVAGMGEDFSAIHVRVGCCSMHHEEHNGLTAPALQELVERTAAEWALWHNTMLGKLSQAQQSNHPMVSARDIPIKVDSDGMGGFLPQYLRENGYTAIAIGAGTKAIESGERGYPNRRSELWFTTAEKARLELIDLSRLPEEILDEMRRQAMSVTWSMNNKGQRVVLSKPDMKKKIKGRSPDTMDAFNLAHALDAAGFDALPVNATPRNLPAKGDRAATHPRGHQAPTVVMGFQG